MANKELKRFRELVVQGIPAQLPPPAKYDDEISHAPNVRIYLPEKRKCSPLKTLRYFPKQHHKELVEFAKELESYGRIYMYRFRPNIV